MCSLKYFSILQHLSKNQSHFLVNSPELFKHDTAMIRMVVFGMMPEILQCLLVLSCSMVTHHFGSYWMTILQNTKCLLSVRNLTASWFIKAFHQIKALTFRDIYIIFTKKKFEISGIEMVLIQAIKSFKSWVRWKIVQFSEILSFVFNLFLAFNNLIEKIKKSLLSLEG